ncbi:MAG: hypothetical protein ACRDXC_00115 [Acidimicrobiales bacterium]
MVSNALESMADCSTVFEHPSVELQRCTTASTTSPVDERATTLVYAVNLFYAVTLVYAVAA